MPDEADIPSAAPINLYGLTRLAVGELLIEWGFKALHANRIWRAIYFDGVEQVAQISGIPERIRAQLMARCYLGSLATAVETHSSDGFTRKYLLRLSDGRQIETVLMRYSGRVTACISSQVGCAMGCVFCATGQMGFTRHLTAAEIVAQVVHVNRVLQMTAQDEAPPTLAQPGHLSPHARHERLRNVVFMGMGEPMHNFDAVMTAVEILRDAGGLALKAERITVSTVGLVPGIRRLIAERSPVNLAVSLHGATQAERSALVPVAKRWPIEDLIQACWDYTRELDRRIFFEWTLIEGENDTEAAAHAVGALLQGMSAQINLIPLNPTAGYGGRPTETPASRRFQEILAEYGLPSTMRQRRGIDIAAGCGQLAAAS